MRTYTYPSRETRQQEPGQGILWRCHVLGPHDQIDLGIDRRTGRYWSRRHNKPATFGFYASRSLQGMTLWPTIRFTLVLFKRAFHLELQSYRLRWAIATDKHGHLV